MGLPSHKDIFKHWESYLWEIGKLARIDYCFACNLEKPLEIAHILARCKGGNDKVDNLHLLCNTCHIDSEYITGDIYFKWLKERSTYEALISSASKSGINIYTLFLKHLELQSTNYSNAVFNKYGDNNSN